MWAKTAGGPSRGPLKASTLPSEGKGDCSGSLTLAEKLPSPINEERQMAIASLVVEGSMLPMRQRARPRVSGLPWLLTAIEFCSSGGGPPVLVEPISPEKLTA